MIDAIEGKTRLPGKATEGGRVIHLVKLPLSWISAGKLIEIWDTFGEALGKFLRSKPTMGLLSPAGLIYLALAATACQSHRYVPVTYDRAIEGYAVRDRQLLNQKIGLSCFRHELSQVLWDGVMCDRVESLLSQQGASVTIQPKAAATAKNDDFTMEINTDLRWVESSEWSMALNIFTMGCYPKEKQRWYQTDIALRHGQDLVGRRQFKALWFQYTSWCYFLYSKASSWVLDTPTTRDYLHQHSDQFDRTLSQLAYSGKKLVWWQQQKTEVVR